MPRMHQGQVDVDVSHQLPGHGPRTHVRRWCESTRRTEMLGDRRDHQLRFWREPAARKDEGRRTDCFKHWLEQPNVLSIIGREEKGATADSSENLARNVGRARARTSARTGQRP